MTDKPTVPSNAPENAIPMWTDHLKPAPAAPVDAVEVKVEEEVSGKSKK